MIFLSLPWSGTGGLRLGFRALGFEVEGLGFKV